MKIRKSVVILSSLLACLFMISCTGEAGVRPDPDGGSDADVPDADADADADAGCAEERRCGIQCCGDNQECVNHMACLPICPSTRCGENLFTCCGNGQICLDGVDCAADCADGESLCGANLNVCCPAGTLCLHDQCAVPAGDCDNHFDCPDESYYCEPAIGKCLRLPAGPLCEGEATFMAIEPTLEWYWRGTTVLGKVYTDSMAAPVVGDVDGDGVPDIVVVLFHLNLYTTDSVIVVLSGDGDGAGGGRILFTIPSDADPTAPKPFGGSAVALANFDDDPGLEIVYNVQGGGVRIADNDGIGEVCDTTNYPACSGLRLSGASYKHIYGGPGIADLDHDGMPDIVLGCHALNGHNIADPALDFVNQAGCGKSVQIADLNQDGKPEIFDGSRAYTVDPLVPGGTTFWTNAHGLSSGFSAVADILPDLPGPEIAYVYNNFYLVDGLTGTLLIGPGGTLVDATIPIPGTGNGGAPTLADFDGDGLLEISSAGRAEYVVYDPDCYDPPLRSGGVCASARTDLILWTTLTQDLSSSMTGSSVFDFQGDGRAEVLYNDECFFHIYDGTTGAELVSPMIPGSSGTLAEYPLVADVDGDGNSEMIIVSNKYAVGGLQCRLHWKNAGVPIDGLCQLTDCVPQGPCAGGIGGTCTGDLQCDAAGICQQAGGTVGVRVYGDSYDRWVRTRPIWNQFDYHVTNIEYANGLWNVPAVEDTNWLLYNNYRQNVQGGALFPVPDLQVDLTAAALCPSIVRLSAVVRNEGSAAAAPGVNVHFYRTDVTPLQYLGSLSTTTLVLPGGWERLTYVYEGAESGVDMTFLAVVNEGAVLEECDPGNNDQPVGPIRCDLVE
ncbi:hypothetical protein KKC22_06040 [Myxococcota bacterium]|nr:hypothetical protein [Myxococcota bacterium]